MITPPVALASFSAAGIAGADMSKTGWTAVMIASSSYLIPFAFVINPAMLMIGTVYNVILVTLFTLLGIFSLSAGVIGHVFTKISFVTRSLFLTSAILDCSGDNFKFKGFYINGAHYILTNETLKFVKYKY